MIWSIPGTFALILLAIYFRTNNLVWPGLIIGIVIGSISAVVSAIKRKGFDWSLIVKISILATLIGFVADILGKLSEAFKA